MPGAHGGPCCILAGMVGGRGPAGELWNRGTQQLVGNGATDEGGIVLNYELKSQEVLGSVVWTLRDRGKVEGK